MEQACILKACKGVFTLARFHGRFRTKLACLVMKQKKICNKMC
jgi:hypothetical protein